jgi:hypothetical protein
MTTIAELDRQIAALQAQKAELEKQWPQCGDYYVYLNADGYPWTARWGSDDTDRNRQKIGNTFRTTNDAELRQQQMIVTQKLRDIRGDWKPDWNNGEWDKFFIQYDHRNKKYWFGVAEAQQMSCSIYMPSGLHCERALALGDELNCLLEDV